MHAVTERHVAVGIAGDAEPVGIGELIGVAIGGADPWQTLGSSDDGNNWLATILGIQGQVTPQKAADQFARLSTLNAADNTMTPPHDVIQGVPNEDQVEEIFSHFNALIHDEF